MLDNKELFTRQIEDLKSRLELMKEDVKLVSSTKSKELIQQEINAINRRIENKEFKLWKLDRGYSL